MNSLFWSKLKQSTIAITWALLFLALPVTSFPFFPGEFGGKTLVRPLAVYPLLILLLFITIPRFYKRQLPITFLPLLAFVIIAVISALSAFYLEIEELRGVSMLSRSIRNMVTLGIGLSFFFTVALIHDTREDLNRSLRWLFLGLVIALLWGTFQTVYVVHFSEPYFEWISTIQKNISIRKLFVSRISGLTYEPKWFAEQICFLFLPWLLGSVITRKSAFQMRVRGITFEWILLIWSAVIVAFTFSRTGIFILVTLSFLSFLIFRSHVQAQKPTSKKKTIQTRWRKLLEASLIAAGVLTLIVILSAQNKYISRFWRYWTEDAPGKKTYLEYIAFQQRFVYWQTAINIFSEYPLVGVGPGNYAYFFEQKLPDQPYNRQPEIVRQITPVEGRNRLLTPKNLYARLLAETGLLGTITFTSFVLAVLGCALYLWFSNNEFQRFWGISSLFAMVVFIFVIFSFDSFALPNMWIVFGLITAAAHLGDPQTFPNL